jgi:hypothetical protein
MRRASAISLRHASSCGSVMVRPLPITSVETLRITDTRA